MYTIEVLERIVNDMKNDMKELDGKPFNGKTMAQQFGKQAAAITTLARIIKIWIGAANGK